MSYFCFVQSVVYYLNVNFSRLIITSDIKQRAALSAIDVNRIVFFFVCVSIRRCSSSSGCI